MGLKKKYLHVSGSKQKLLKTLKKSAVSGVSSILLSSLSESAVKRCGSFYRTLQRPRHFKNSA